MATQVIVDRPQRWDQPFGPDMTEADVDRLLKIWPFSDMDPARTRGVLRNDTRLLRKLKRGEIVMRKGDYGTSAYLILSGALRAVTEGDLPPSVVGRRVVAKRKWKEILGQLWSGFRDIETRDRKSLKADPETTTSEEEGGRVSVIIKNVDKVIQTYETGVREAPMILGELGALTRMPRAVTVFVDSDDTELLEIRWQGLKDLRQFGSSLRAKIDETYRRFALDPFLKEEVPIFRHLSEDHIKKVIAAAQFQTIGDFEWSGDYKKLVAMAGANRSAQQPTICAAGEYPNGVIVVRAGFARLSQSFGHGERTLAYLGVSHTYGLREIAHNWRSKNDPVAFQQTLRALGYTHVVLIPTAIMEEIVLPSIPPEELPPLVEKEKSSVPKQDDADSAISPDFLEFVSEHRFFNGRQAMLIDLDLCTRCDDCVRACAQTHGNNPRFLRHGPTSGNIMVANACMHCADPVCMIGCPTGAIHRIEHGEVVINQTTCIGCAICANNCPYDAIRMTEIRDEKGVFMVDTNLKPILKATKCDLCVQQYGGPACERACPHGALTRADMSDLDSLADWLKR